MRIYFFLTTIGLATIALFNFNVDPEKVWSRAPGFFLHPIPEGKVEIYPNNSFVERDIKLSLLKKSDLLIMGSSRAMTFDQTIIRPEVTLLNLGFSAGSIDEYRTFWCLVKKNNFTPQFLLINLEPFSFNKNADKGDALWRFKRHSLKQACVDTDHEGEFVDRLNALLKDSKNLMGKSLTLVQWNTLISSVKYLLANGVSNQSPQQIISESDLSPELGAYRGDGSFMMPKKFLLNLKIEDVRKSALTLPPVDPQTSYQYRKYDFDSQVLDSLIQFIQDASGRGVHVMLMVTPFHPLSFERIMKDPYYIKVFDEFNAALISIQKKIPEIPICDLVDNNHVECDETEFTDAYHMKGSCDRKVLRYCFSKSDRWNALLPVMKNSMQTTEKP